MAVIVIALIVAIALGAFFWHKDEPRREQALQTSLDAMQGFNPSLTLFGADGGTGIALDPGSREIGLLRPGRSAQRIPAAQVLAAELYRDGEPLAAVQRPGADARVSELKKKLSPPVVHRAEGEITRWQEVRRVELRLILDADTAPAYDVRILDREVRETDAVYGEAVSAGKHWLAQLGGLMQ
ncbi:hypothetical protein FOZ76_22955 [Verticiella sediminum]|uniref:Uncharacterized protein n=1 Tax=Verticiella sediminum TaxID=1247510 RepID=A0A556ACQ0_9BURK|nr:hypothetical protein [Verticiella sediminum]TSH90661.1 hypothetical protein FOZ76_22955 [Verticiella sediminum]